MTTKLSQNALCELLCRSMFGGYDSAAWLTEGWHAQSSRDEARSFDLCPGSLASFTLSALSVETNTPHYFFWLTHRWTGVWVLERMAEDDGMSERKWGVVFLSWSQLGNQEKKITKCGVTNWVNVRRGVKRLRKDLINADLYIKPGGGEQEKEEGKAGGLLAMNADRQAG